MSDIVAVVLNWNGGEETQRCLRSLRLCRGLLPRVLLADNGSVDGSVERALAEDPTLEVLRFGKNLGYTGGNNRALRHAFEVLGAPWACLLNNDVVVEPDTFSRLWEGVQGQDRVGAAGPCLVGRDRPDVIWAEGGRIAPGLNVTQLLRHGERREPSDAARPLLDVDYVPGAFLLVSREAMEKAGPLDEEFFCYLEDADWGLRLRQAGLRAVVVPAAVAQHGLSASTGGGYSAGRKYMTGVNSVRFLRKHGDAAGWVGLFVFDLLLWPLAFVKGAASGRGTAAVAKLRGVFAGLSGARVDAAVADRYARARPR